MSAVTGLPALDNTMGAIFLGVVVAGMLWGITCMQTFEYASMKYKDPLYFKVMVYTIFALDTVHQAFMIHISYTYLVTEYANPLFLNVLVWTLVAQILPAVLVGGIVQSFFVWRVYILSGRSKILAGAIFAMVVANFTLGTVYFVKGWSIASFPDIARLNGLSRAVNATGVAGDVSIACALIWILQRSKTGFSKSNTIINQLILYSLNTGFATSLCALGSLISISLAPNTSIFIFFYAILSRMYTNSLLATLNGRKKTKEIASSASATFEHSLAHTREGARSQKQFNVQIKTETAMAFDKIPDVESKGAAEGYELNVFSDKR